MDTEETMSVKFVIEMDDTFKQGQRQKIEDFLTKLGIEFKDTYYRPHEEILPLPEHKAPGGCNLRGFMGVCYFLENNNWIPYWHDGHYFSVEEVDKSRDFYK